VDIEDNRIQLMKFFGSISTINFVKKINNLIGLKMFRFHAKKLINWMLHSFLKFIIHLYFTKLITK
jgi:hypothetical protein